MKLKFILLLLFVFSANFTTRAQDAQATPTPKSEPITQNAKTEQKYTAQDYADLVAKLKGGDTGIDFTALRMAFTKTEEYSYGGTDKAEKEKMLKPFNDKKYKEALKQAEKILEKNYTEANAHFVAYNAAKELKDEKKAEFHKAVLLGLLSSIKNGNDGLSAEKPFKVITIDEEYTLMRFLGYQVGGQGLQNVGGHQFDVLDATNAKTSEKAKFYFNIDIVWKAETEIFGK
jgi:hypothetical protein